MQTLISLDSLYLVVKPCVEVQDVFYRFWEHVEELPDQREGVVVDEWLLRKGGIRGYKFSAWQGDARIFFCESPDRGLWVQLGPKFLLSHLGELPAAVERLLVAAGLPVGCVLGAAPLKVVVNRIDLCVDCLGVAMADFRVSDWVEGWVGYAETLNSWSGCRVLETVNIGARGGTLYLRVYDKVKEAAKTGDLAYWVSAWGGWVGPVTRVEWEVKPEGDGFADLVGFSDFGGPGTGWENARLMQLAAYLVAWGHLAVPSRTDRDEKRWPRHKFWRDLEAGVVGWAAGAPALERARSEALEVSPEFIDYVGDALVAGMAKFSECGELGPERLLEFLASKGWGLDKIQARARAKFEKLSKLRSRRAEAV